MTPEKPAFYCLTAVFVLLGTAVLAQAPTIPLQDSLQKYARLGRYAKAVPFAEQWRDEAKKAKGETSVEYADALSDLGEMLYRSGKMEEGGTAIVQALEIRQKALGQTDAKVGESYHQAGSFNTAIGEYATAEGYYEKAYAIRKNAFGEEGLQTAGTLSNWGVSNMDAGNFGRADSLLSRALDIRKKKLGENDLEVGRSYNNLGILYWKTGKFPKAEASHQKCLEIRIKVLGENHPDVAHSYNNLGLVYIYMGNLPKGETYLLKGMEIKRKAIGDNNLDMAASYNNLANLNKNMGRFGQSLEYNRKSLAIKEKMLEPTHPDLGSANNNMGELHHSLGNYALAEKYLLKALEIWKNAFGPDNVDVAGAYTNLGNLYIETRQPAKAEFYYTQSLNLRKKVLGVDHPDLAHTYNNLGLLWKDANNYAKAEPFFRQSSQSYLNQIQRFFPAWSDAEKEDFFEMLTPYLEEFKAFAAVRYATHPAISGELYNHQLATKALLLNSSAKWKHRIKSSGDKKLFLQFTEWENYQNQLAVLLQSTDSTERAGIDSIQAKSEKMEKDLSIRSENFAKLADRKLTSWKEVQKTLKPGEAAVEMIRVQVYGMARTVTDTSDPQKPIYKVKGLTDTLHYAALIVKPESKYPEMVLLKNGNDLEGKHLKLYQNCIKQQLPDGFSYKQFWEKIGAKLGTSSKIYFSPDGVFHSINLNTLLNPKTKKYLLEEKEIKVVTVTKDLLNRDKGEDLNKLAYLIGFPSYYQDGDESVAISTERKSPTLAYGLRLPAGEILAQLPATKVEVTRISDILQAKGWDVQLYTEGKALEENVKESYKPRLMHVATHGYFQPDTSKDHNPLLRSGLMLTGAGTTLQGKKSETREDGILTAYEAMNLNLDNTDLVVLSACETGLGEIKNSEGVYGLQRAFKVAGAKSIIMSLWQVNDQTTQELMVSFYRHWLAEAAGGKNSKRTAFLKAQKELKTRFPSPYYWGAFVLVGE